MKAFPLAILASKILERLGLEESQPFEIPPRFTLPVAILLKERPLSILRSSVKDLRTGMT
jgi:hypothetical protein